MCIDLHRRCHFCPSAMVPRFLPSRWADPHSTSQHPAGLTHASEQGLLLGRLAHDLTPRIRNRSPAHGPGLRAAMRRRTTAHPVTTAGDDDDDAWLLCFCMTSNIGRLSSRLQTVLRECVYFRVYGCEKGSR